MMKMMTMIIKIFSKIKIDKNINFYIKTMGVPKVYKLLIESISMCKTADLERPFSLCMDLNGFIHRLCGYIYGYAEKDLENRTIPRNKIEDIRRKLQFDKFDELKYDLKANIKLALNKLILEVIKPTTVLIITIDGIAPFAKVNQQRFRRAKSGHERQNYYEDENGKRINEMRIHEMKNQGINIQRYALSSDCIFDTAHITAGTPFMKEISDCVKEWIEEKKSYLPLYTFFSGVDFRGEGEHKMFKLLNEAIKMIVDVSTTSEIQDVDKKKKLYEETIKREKHLIYGNDADLLFLSIIRDYNFIWMKEGYHLFELTEGVIVNQVREYVINKMKGKISKVTPQIKKRILIDFCIISFFIGDDFVPSMFTINNNIKITLDRFMETYSTLHTEKEFNSITDENDSIYTGAFCELIRRLVPIEKELYERKALIDKLEREVVTNTTLIEEVNRYREENKIKVIGHKYSDNYVPCNYLQYNYEEFLDFWKNVLVRPSIMSSRNVSAQNITKTNILCNISDETKNDHVDYSCQDYLTGLQWNIKYYLGERVNNWFYRGLFPPTISALCDFINSNKWINKNVNFLPGDFDLTVKQMLSITISNNFSNRVITSVFETENKYFAFMKLSPYLSTIHVSNFANYFQGKYLSELYQSLPLLPQIDLNMINHKEKNQEIYNHDTPGVPILGCNSNIDVLREILLNAGRATFGADSIQTIKNRDQLEQEQRKYRRAPTPGRGESGRSMIRNNGGRISTYVDRKRPINIKSGGLKDF